MFGNSKEYQDLQKLYAEKVSKPENIDENVKEFLGKINPFKKKEVKVPMSDLDKIDAKKEQELQNLDKSKLQKIEAEAKAAADKKDVEFRLKNTESSEQSANAEKREPAYKSRVTGADRAKALAKARIAAKKAGTYQKPKTAQELARERIARKNAQMNNSFIPNGETIEERLGGRGVSKKAAAGSIYPGEKGDGQTEDQDRGEGNRAKRRANQSVENKSPTFLAYIKNKKEDKKKDDKMEAYDIVLEYLLTSQQAATIEEANYIMTEMDAKTIQDIVSQQLNEQN